MVEKSNVELGLPEHELGYWREHDPKSDVDILVILIPNFPSQQKFREEPHHITIGSVECSLYDKKNDFAKVYFLPTGISGDKNIKEITLSNPQIAIRIEDADPPNKKTGIGKNIYAIAVPPETSSEDEVKTHFFSDIFGFDKYKWTDHGKSCSGYKLKIKAPRITFIRNAFASPEDDKKYDYILIQVAKLNAEKLSKKYA